MATAPAPLALDDAARAPAPSFTPPSFTPPAAFPPLPAWLGAARRDALELFPRACFEQPFVAHRLLGHTLVIISDPAAIADITGRSADLFGLTNLHLRMLAPALGRGIIVAEGERWKLQRRAAIRLVAAARERPGVSLVDDRLALQLAAWRAADGAPVAIQQDLVLLAVDLLAAELFRHRVALAPERIAAAVARHRTIVERADLLDMIGAPPWLSSGRLRRARRLVRGFDGDIHAAIRASRDFAAPPGLPPEVQRDLVVNIMSGFESIALTSQWLLGLVAAHPPLHRWLTDPHADEAERTRRLDRAIAETLRLYPPLPLIYRRAHQAHETGVGTIPRGAMVCIAPYVVQRHAAYWPDPLRFDPGRELPAGKASAYMPFGVGARQCIGRHVGPRLVARIVSAVLTELRPRLAAPLPRPRAGLSLRPETPLLLAFERG